jgi:hypothetical protein
MATERQFEFFKSLFEAEIGRRALLQGHAKDNLALATFYSAFILFVVEKFTPTTIVTKALFVLCVGAMMVSFFLSLLATQVASYEVPTKPSAILERFGGRPPTDDEFFDERIVDYAVAYERCVPINDRKARLLLVARYLLLAGVLSHASYFIVGILRTPS